MKKVKRFACPLCGCEEIADLSLYVVATPVTKWNGSGLPEEYGNAEIDWTADYPYGHLFDRRPISARTLECMDCGAHFEKPELAR